MAAHHHHQHQHHHQLHNPPTPYCNSSLGHGCTVNCNPSCDCNLTVHCPSPPLECIDPLLLRSLASHKVHAQSRRFQRLNPRKLHQEEPQQRQADFLISSLVSRIEALEASLGRFPPSRSREDFDFRYRSLRDLAARVIQTHFRAFLVRRSRTLRQLKDLAVIKSDFGSLKSSISGEISSDFYTISRKATDLLVKLDTIQGDDSMVRDGKRSISRDLVRFLEFIEGLCVKRHELSLRSRKNVRFVRSADKPKVFLNRKGSDLSGDQRQVIGKLRERVEKIRGYSRVSRNGDEDVVLEAFQHVSDDDDEQEEEEELEHNHVVVIREKGNPVRNGVLVNKKRVSFAENRNMLKLFSDKDEPVADEDGTNCLDGDSTTSSEEQNPEAEEIKVFSLGTEDYGDEEGHVVNKAYSQRPGNSSRKEGDIKIRGHNGELLFSAPLPVTMEDKADLLKRRNEVEILR